MNRDVIFFLGKANALTYDNFGRFVHKCCVGSRTPVKFPLYAYCQLNSGLEEANRWVRQHLFVFEKNDRSKYGRLMNGNIIERSHTMEPPFTPHQFGTTIPILGRPNWPSQRIREAALSLSMP